MNKMTASHFLVFLWTFFSSYREIAGTICSDAVTDGTTVLNMCEDGIFNGDSVVIDTYNSSDYRSNGGSISCSCTATLGGLSDGTTTTVDFGTVQSLYPQSGCRSVITLNPQLQAFPVQPNIFECRVSNITFNLVQNNDTFNVVWDSGTSGSMSEYCLSLKTGSGSLSLKCNSMIQEQTTVPTAMTSVMTTSRPTTRFILTIPTTSPSQETTSAKTNENELDMPVIIGITVGGVVLLIVCIIVAVLWSRSKDKKKEEPRETPSVVHNNNTFPRRMYLPNMGLNHEVDPDSDAYDQLHKNSSEDEKDLNLETDMDLYDHIHEPEPEIQHVAAPNGDVYAEVQKTTEDVHL